MENNRNNSIYIGNLPYSVTKEEVEELFSECGEINDVKIIMDRETGRAKGFGFVSFASRESMETALGKSNLQLGGRDLRVNEAVDNRK